MESIKLKNAPIISGYYWARYKPYKRVEIVKVSHDHNGSLYIEDGNLGYPIGAYTDYYGPLLPPEEYYD